MKRGISFAILFMLLSLLSVSASTWDWSHWGGGSTQDSWVLNTGFGGNYSLVKTMINALDPANSRTQPIAWVSAEVSGQSTARGHAKMRGNKGVKPKGIKIKKQNSMPEKFKDLRMRLKR